MYHLIVASFEAKRYEKTHLKSVTFLTIEGEATRGSFVTIQYPGGTSCASQAPMALRQFVEMVESVCGWPQTLSTISTLCAPQARVLDAFLNLDDFIGFQAVGLAVYRCCRLLVGSLDKAEVHPLRAHAVLPLRSTPRLCDGYPYKVAFISPSMSVTIINKHVGYE